MCGLLLLLLLADADVRVAELELQGAEEMVKLCKARQDRVQAHFQAGTVTQATSTEVQRILLDARLHREQLRRALAIAKGGKEPVVTPVQHSILRSLERLESGRLARVRLASDAGLVPTAEVSRAELRHQLAWIERNFADRLMQKGADQKALELRRNQDRAKVRLRTAEKLVELYQKTKPGSDELFAAQAERVRALTASKVAKVLGLPKR